MNDSSSSTTSTVADGSAIRFLSVEGRQRQPQGERRPLALPRLHRHPAAVVVDHMAHDRKAETGAAGVPGPGPIDPVETFEDAIEVAGRDADAVIAHGQVHPTGFGVAFDADLDGRALVAVLHRVLDQV